MGKTILFSAVGGTDPISEKNCYDGALLHIARVYRPDKIVMYMSSEILQKHEKDNRYLYCLDRLSEKLGVSFAYKVIKRPELREVQDFDYFYQDFQQIIQELIAQEYEEGDTFLLNISSGTPAMKSGILVLKTMMEYPCRLIQVTTPEEGMNEHRHSEQFEAEELWELDPDNEPGFKNRCTEVSCPNLTLIKKAEIIRQEVLAYNYSAAYDIAAGIPGSEQQKYRQLLYIAKQRNLLNIAEVNRLSKTAEVDFIPIKEEKACQLFEYALSTSIKLKRGEYADFIRSLTPMVLVLLLDS